MREFDRKWTPALQQDAATKAACKRVFKHDKRAEWAIKEQVRPQALSVGTIAKPEDTLTNTETAEDSGG
jgi:hypothetical protein